MSAKHIGVLTGAYVFMADLVRRLMLPEVRCAFIKVVSYEQETESEGPKEIVPLVGDEPVSGRHVLLVEDIVDTGRTLDALIKVVVSFAPASVRVVSLLDKTARRAVEVNIDYVGFKVPNRWVVGYGIDFNGRFRNLPYVAYLRES